MAAVTMTDIALPESPGGSRGLTGVLGVPVGSGPWPGVVVVHEAYGVNDVMRRQVAHIASLGYLALMPDLFSDGGARRCLAATFRALRSGEGRAFVDIATARDLLASRDDCTGNVGVLGFCMGWVAVVTRARPVSRLWMIVLGLFAAALVALAVLQVVPGRFGYWLDLGRLMLAAYLVGCAIGSWLRDRFILRQAPQV